MMSAGKSKASITPEAEKPASLPVTKLEPTEAEQAEILAHAERRQAPRFAVCRQEDNQVQMMPTGVHADVAGVGLMNAFGTTNLDLAERLMMQIITATHLQSSNEPVAEANLNAALAAVTGIAPRDEAEAMLAAQMAAVHMASMTFARRLNHIENIPQQDSAERAFNKLTRTFTTQMEALKRYRTGGQQKVTVEHVTVQAGGQAIVGNVSHAPGGGSLSKIPETTP